MHHSFVIHPSRISTAHITARLQYSFSCAKCKFTEVRKWLFFFLNFWIIVTHYHLAVSERKHSTSWTVKDAIAHNIKSLDPNRAMTR